MVLSSCLVRLGCLCWCCFSLVSPFTSKTEGYKVIVQWEGICDIHVTMSGRGVANEMF